MAIPMGGQAYENGPSGVQQLANRRSADGQAEAARTLVGPGQNGPSKPGGAGIPRQVAMGEPRGGEGRTSCVAGRPRPQSL